MTHELFIPLSNYPNSKYQPFFDFPSSSRLQIAMAASLRVRPASLRPSSNSLSSRPPPPTSAPHRLPSFASPEGIRKRAAWAALVAGAAGINNFDVSVGDGKKKGNPIIVIDNYDSFTYNLCQYIGELGTTFEVYRNDELTIKEMKRKNPRGVLISPGPGTPQDSGISLQTVLELGPTVPLFGVCMGLQCIGEAFGGRIVRSPFGVMHGKSSRVFYDEKGEDGLLAGLSNPFTAGRYHSLVIEKDSFPDDALEVTAWTEEGLIMAARHRKYKHVQGVQFHPESIITSEGKRIVRSFLRLIERMEAAGSDGS